MLLSSGEPSTPRTGEPADESVSQNNKRALSYDGQETSTAKRAKAVKDAVPSPRKPKASQRSVTMRVPTMKRKRDPGPGELRWSVVPFSDSPRTVSSNNLERANVWPRLWSSNREELFSAFPEISGSRCVNNISWAATDMPILILDDELVMLEKPDVVDNGLCMDVIFAREFAFVASCSPPEVENTIAPNVHESTTNISNDLGGTQPLAPANEPVATTESLSQPTKNTVPLPVEVLAPSGHPPVKEASAPNEPTSPLSAPPPHLVIQIPRQKQRKAAPEVVPRSADSSTTPTSGARTAVERKTGKASSTLSSLRFKKIRPVVPDTPTGTNIAMDVTPPPQVFPAVDSHPPEPFPPETQSLAQRDFPIDTASFEPAFTRYPDNRHLPEAYSLLGELPGKFAASFAASHSRCLTGPGVLGTESVQRRVCGEEVERPGASDSLREVHSAQTLQPGVATYPNNVPLGRPRRSWNLDAAPKPSGPWEWPDNKPQRVFKAPPHHNPTVNQLSTYDSAWGIGGASAVEDMPQSAFTVRPSLYTVGNQLSAAGSNRSTGDASALLQLSGPGVTGAIGTTLGGTLQRDETIQSSAPGSAPLHAEPQRPPVDVEPAVPSAPDTLNDNIRESCAGPNPSWPLKWKGKGKEKALADEQPSSVTQQTTGPKKRGRPPKKPKLDAGAELTGTEANPVQAQAPTFGPSLSSSSQVKVEDLSAILHLDHSSLEGGDHTFGGPGPEPGAVEEPTPVPSVTILPKKRGRPPKSAKSRLQPSSSVTPIQTDTVEPSQSQPHSLQSSKPRPIPKPKPKPRPGEACLGENGIPSPIPDELKALVDAYINGLPVGVFASTNHLRGFWGVKLAQEGELGYVFMGFYRISRVWEALKGPDGGGDRKQWVTVENGVTKGHVRWRFRMKWEPGGEEMQVCQQEKLLSPWWKPFARVQGLVTLPRLDLEDSDNESTVDYRMARRKGSSFSQRHCSFNQVFFSVLPLHLLAPIDAAIPDSMFPCGWYCGDCGKLNFRYYLRHRRCGSFFCRNKPAAEGYAEDIDTLRDPQDVLPLTLPMNEYPSDLNVKLQNWSDRMKTIIYRLDAEHSVVLQHIFTCNLRDLQKEASDLLNKIQIHVPLRRLTGDSSTNPFFMYFAGDGEKEVFVPWKYVPECLVYARALMNERGRKYGKKTATELDIKQLMVRAWVTSGSKRGSNPLCAKDRCIAIMCLGCEVIISISAKTVSDVNQVRIPDYDKIIPMEDFPESKLEGTAGMGGETGEELSKDISALTLSAPEVAAETGVVARRQKATRTAVSVSLIHGDILLLEGDEFEYSLKRSGTSILLFGM